MFCVGVISTLFFPLLLISSQGFVTTAFVVHHMLYLQPQYDLRYLRPKTQLTHSSIKNPLHLTSSPHSNNDDDHLIGDPIRSQTGIRPSLHPTTINALSQAILLYYQPSLDPTLPMKVSSSSSSSTEENTTPLQVAISAGQLAWTTIEHRNKRQRLSKDGPSQDVASHHLDTEAAFTPEEAQVISGRVVGVVLRMTQLESMLVQQLQKSPWVSKYKEYDIFGVTVAECCSGDLNVACQSLMHNPLLRMCRAECLLALFIHHIEIPGLKKAGVEQITGGSEIDFIDQERLVVLLK